jgi:hypothetical protein
MIDEFAPAIEDENLRWAVRRAARGHAGGFAGLARSTGIRIPTLQRFLRGAHPGRSTGRALRASVPPGAGMRPHLAVLGLSVLIYALPQRLRMPARQALALGLANVYEAYGAALPEWLQEELRVP